jgi:hypothetical protein
VGRPGAGETEGFAESRTLLNETNARLNGMKLGPMTAAARGAADTGRDRIHAALALGALEPLVRSRNLGPVFTFVWFPVPTREATRV